MFLRKKALLIGDAILDVYIYSEITNRALYAPVPEVEEKRIAISFGGSGLVASNILELGGELRFITVIGKDSDAKIYDSFRHPKLKKFFIVDKSRKTTVKKRWFANGRALLQANQVDNHEISPAIEKKVIGLIKKNIRDVDVVTIMDPQHGMLTRNLIKNILKLSRKHSKPLYVNAQISHRPSNHNLYKGADTFLLNEKEAKAVGVGFARNNLKKSLKRIAKKLKARSIIVSLGAKGSAALIGGNFIKTPTIKVKAVDVAGAGDAFLAAYSLGDPNNPEANLKLANAWAALSTTIHGTIPPKKKDLVGILKKLK